MNTPRPFVGGVWHGRVEFDGASVIDVEPLLSLAEKLLAEEPRPGERIDRVAMRQARIQHALLTAQLAMLREQIRVRRLTP